MDGSVSALLAQVPGPPYGHQEVRGAALAMEQGSMFDSEQRDVSSAELERACQLVADAIAHLAGRERQVLVRLFLQKISAQAVATELGVSAAAVMDLAAKALSGLSRRLAGQIDSQRLDPENEHYRAMLRKAGFDPSRIDELVPKKTRLLRCDA